MHARFPIHALLAALVVLAAAAGPSLGQGGLIRDPQTGCATSNPFPRENESITWTGGCENGLLSGYGVLTWRNGEETYERDEGVFRAGELDGPAIISFADGSRVYGSYRAGRRDGDFIIDRGEDGLVLARYEDGQFVSERALSEAENASWRQQGERAFAAALAGRAPAPVRVVGNRETPTPPPAPPATAAPAAATAAAAEPAPPRPEPSQPDPDFGPRTFTLRLAETDVAAVAAVVFGNLLRLPYTVEAGADERLSLQPDAPVTGNALLATLRDALSRRGLRAVRRKGVYVIDRQPAPANGGVIAATPRPGGLTLVPPAAPGLRPPPAPSPVARAPVARAPATAAAVLRPPQVVPRPAVPLPATSPLPAIFQPPAGFSAPLPAGLPGPSFPERVGRSGGPGGPVCLRQQILGYGRGWCGQVQAVNAAGVAVKLTAIDLSGADQPVLGPTVCTGGLVLSRFAVGRVIVVPGDCLGAF